MRIRRLLAAILAWGLLATAMPLGAFEALAATKYYITVDLTNQIVTVYDSGNVTQSGIVRQMICSSGKSGTRTPTGTYYLPTKSVSSERTEWYYFSKYNCYAKWATRITGGILFHSVLYTASKNGPTSSSVNALGSPASHGCIRLRVDDAKFIAKNCLSGTKCRIYYSGTTNSSLRTKLKRRSFIRDNESYEAFLGTALAESKLPLSQGSTGSLVRQLQTRLTELGFLNDTIDGIFGSKTLSAVQAFQSAAGLAKTTSVSQTLWNSIFAASAPTKGGVTLSEGSKSAAVAELQRALIDLKLLSDSADGIFGAKTLAAVKLYQSTFGYAVTGTVTAELQKTIVAHAERVRAQFGGGDYALTTTQVQGTLARVKVNSFLNLRQTPSSTGEVLAKLENGTVLQVLEQGDWLRVSYNGQTGYVKSSYVELYTGTVNVPDYVSVGLPTPTPTVEPTVTPEPDITPVMGEPPLEPNPPAELLLTEDGAESPFIFASAPQGEALPLTVSDHAVLAVVNADGATLYARVEASPDDAIGTVEAGMAFPVLSISGDWVSVSEGWLRLEDVQLIDDSADMEWIYGDEPAPESVPETETETENGLTIEPEWTLAEDIGELPPDVSEMGGMMP